MKANELKKLRKVNRKIVKDTTRILTNEGKMDPDGDLISREQIVSELLARGASKELAAKIDHILQKDRVPDAAEKKKLKLPKKYLKNTQIMLNRYIKEPKQEEVDKNAEAYAAIDEVLQDLLDLEYDTTVADYRLLEWAGSQKRLEEILTRRMQEKLDEEKNSHLIKIEVYVADQDNGECIGVMRQKDYYSTLDDQYWKMTCLLPPVLVKLVVIS